MGVLFCAFVHSYLLRSFDTKNVVSNCAFISKMIFFFLLKTSSQNAETREGKHVEMAEAKLISATSRIVFWEGERRNLMNLCLFHV